MKNRLDVAAKAGIEAWNQAEPEHPVSASYVASYVDFTRAALGASDAVMFSDEAIDRAAEALYMERPFHTYTDQGEYTERIKPWDDLTGGFKGVYRKRALVVMAALRGEQP